MSQYDPHFISSLISACADKLEQINEFDSLADDITNLYKQHTKLHSKLVKPSSEPKRGELSNLSKVDDQLSKSTKAKDKGSEKELTGAALEANRVISAILEQYKNKTTKQNTKNKNKAKTKGAADLTGALIELNNSAGVYADCFQFVRSFTQLDDEAIFEQVLNPESPDHDVLVENLVTLSQLSGVALERTILHVGAETAKYCDLNCLLNTCDTLSDNLPLSSLVFDLSACPECAPIQGCIINRLTYFKPGKSTMPFSSAHNDEAIFLEELGLSLKIDDVWYSLGLAATLDNDRTISDLVRELGYYAVDYLEQQEVPPLSEREQLAEPNWDESESIIDPKLQEQAFVVALYHMFKYVTYSLTHLELLKDKQGKAIYQLAPETVKLPQESDALLKALGERLDKSKFKHLYI